MYGERFDEAFVFASQIHREQVRKGSGIPYIIHLMAVTSLVGEHGGTEDQVVAALLHDAIEDCIGAIPDIAEQIEARFGPEVYEIVDGCTDAETLPKPPWEQRKQAHLDSIRKHGLLKGKRHQVHAAVPRAVGRRGRVEGPGHGGFAGR